MLQVHHGVIFNDEVGEQPECQHPSCRCRLWGPSPAPGDADLGRTLHLCSLAPQGGGVGCERHAPRRLNKWRASSHAASELGESAEGREHLGLPGFQAFLSGPWKPCLCVVTEPAGQRLVSDVGPHPTEGGLLPSRPTCHGARNEQARHPLRGPGSHLKRCGRARRMTRRTASRIDGKPPRAGCGQCVRDTTLWA